MTCSRTGSLLPSRPVSQEAQTTEAGTPRPGLVRRAAAGAWHLAAGYWFLVRNPWLWGLAVPTVITTGLLLVCGAIAGIFALPQVDAAVIRDDRGLPDWLDLAILLGLWAGVMLVGLLAGLALAMPVSAPLLERLSRRVEARSRPKAESDPLLLSRATLRSVARSLYLLAALPFVFLLALLPVVGPVLGGLLAGRVLAFQQAEAALARRDLDFRGRWAWHRRYGAESLGLGLAAVMTLLVPIANLVLGSMLAPAIAIGATMLVAELEPREPRPTEPAPPGSSPDR